MNEHYLAKIEEIEKEIDKTDTVIRFLDQKKKVQENEELIQMIRAYHELGDGVSLEKEQLKMQIYKNEDFQLYKHLENELFFLTLAINQRLKKLTPVRKCNL